MSLIWRNIVNLLTLNGNIPELIRVGIGLILGKLDCIKFQHDEWVKGLLLKSAFPKFFALSSFKDGFLDDHGQWASDVRNWKILMRRELYDWKKDQWQLLLKVIEDISLDKDKQNRLIC